MNIGTGILLFQIIWIVLFFMILPWKISASSPKILLKIGITTGISVVTWVVAYTIITYTSFSFRNEKASWMLSENALFSSTLISKYFQKNAKKTLY